MLFIFIISRGLPSHATNAGFVEDYKKSVIAMESAHIDLRTKTLKLVDIEISQRTLLCFAWLVLCLIVNYNTRFSGLTNAWLKSYPQMLNMVWDSQHC